MTAAAERSAEIACSVVIPVFNRGESLAVGIESLRAQTLGADRVEIIYVDDGSNDGYTPAMIDAVVADTRNARVFHEPASGSPGRPRNVGVSHARGEYVFFSDHDDWFEADALERLVDWARRHSSDVVVGKVVGHGRRAAIPRLFRESRASVPAAEAMISLTPHKLFRRAFLNDHQLRYPEGKLRLEDHLFVTHAYLHARTISVYADTVCYHHNDPGTEENFSQTRSDPALYIGSNVKVIELIRRHTEHDVELRDAMLARPVLHELIKKAGPGQLRQIDADGEARKHEALRSALLEAVPPEVVEQLGAFPRATAQALLRDDPAAVLQLETMAASVGLAADLVDLHSDGTEWVMSYRASVVAPDGEPEGGDDAPAVTDLEFLVINRETDVQWHLPTDYEVDGRVVTGRARLEAGDIRVGHIESGLWDVVLRAEVLGLSRRTRLATPTDVASAEATVDGVGLHATALVTKRRNTLALRVTPDA